MKFYPGCENRKFSNLYIKKNVCLYVWMYILYAFRHHTSQSSQNLHGIPLGREELQDEVRAPEGGWEMSPPSFLKFLENLIRFFRYPSPAFKSARCLWIKSHYLTQFFFTSEVLSNLNCWIGTLSVPSKKSERFLNKLRIKGNKNLRFSSLK
jgi:hypothetical protein